MENSVCLMEMYSQRRNLVHISERDCTYILWVVSKIEKSLILMK